MGNSYEIIMVPAFAVTLMYMLFTLPKATDGY